MVLIVPLPHSQWIVMISLISKVSFAKVPKRIANDSIGEVYIKDHLEYNFDGGSPKLVTNRTEIEQQALMCASDQKRQELAKSVPTLRNTPRSPPEVENSNPTASNSATRACAETN